MTTSGRTPRRAISGWISAALPCSAIDSAVPARRAASAQARASSSDAATLVHVAEPQAPLDALPIDLDEEAHAPVQGDGERLGAAHAPEPGGQHEAPRERAAEVLGRAGAEGLVRALQDALRADVDPRARGHLAVHGEAERLVLAEVLPVTPGGDEHGIGDEDAGRVGMRLEDADGLARLHEQRLVGLERSERGHDAVIGLPVPRRLPRAAVHDQVFPALGHVGVEVVHQHAQRGFLGPPLAGERSATGRPDRPLGPAGDRIGHGSSGVCGRVVGACGRRASVGVARGSTGSTGHPRRSLLCSRLARTATLRAPAALNGLARAAARRALLRQDELAGPRDPEAILVVSVQDDQFPQALEEVVARDGPPGWRCRGVSRAVRPVRGLRPRWSWRALSVPRPRLPARRESRTCSSPTDSAIAQSIGAPPRESKSSLLMRVRFT